MNQYRPSISGVIMVDIQRIQWTSDRSQSLDEDPMDKLNRCASSHDQRGCILTLHRQSDDHCLKSIVSIKRHFIATVYHDEPLYLTVTPLFSLKRLVLREWKTPLDFRVKSKCLDTTIQASINLNLLLMHFCIRGAFEIKI